MCIRDRDVAAHQLYQNDTLAVYQALISGAVPLDNLQPVEQGFGAVNMMRAWQELKDMKDSFTAYEVSQYTPCLLYTSELTDDGEILFIDSAAIQDWARASVTYAHQRGIIKGFPDEMCIRDSPRR